MSKKVYVGNLPFSVSEKELSEMFSSYGEITEAIVIKDKYSGQSRGFGFVEMSTEEEAQKAVQGLNGYNLEGRNIVVKEALPKPTYSNGRGGGDRGRRGFGGGRPQRRY